MIAGVGVTVLLIGVFLCMRHSRKKYNKNSREGHEGSQPQRDGRNDPGLYVLQVRGEGGNYAAGRQHGYNGGPPPYRYREDSWVDSKIY